MAARVAIHCAPGAHDTAVLRVGGCDTAPVIGFPNPVIDISTDDLLGTASSDELDLNQLYSFKLLKAS